MTTYGLIGYPLGHSFSRGYFTEKFAREKIDAQYLNFEIPDVAMLTDILRSHPHLRGLNVTLPHKQSVIPLLDALSPEAREIGAVNVIRVEASPSPSKGGVNLLPVSPPLEGLGEACSRKVKLTGFNSDIIGFTESIRPLLQPWHTRALVLGTGGASRAICVGLERLGLEWTYVSRTPGEGRLTYGDITPEVLRDYTVLVNCSPVGMFPRVDAAPDLPYELLTPRHLLFDLVYNPLDTLFMQKGRAQGAVVKNGLEMLHLQAAASWEFWNQ